MAEQITAEQSAAIDVKRMTIVRSVLKASRNGLDAIAGAVEAIGRDRGSGTPAEEFITNVLAIYRVGRFSVESVKDELESMEEGLELAGASARTFARTFPQLMKGPELMEEEQK